MSSTPLKTPRHSRSRSTDSYKFSENVQPNIPISTLSKKFAKSPASRSVPRASKHAPISPSPPPPPRVRKFVVAKKKNYARETSDLEAKKLQEAAYERLRASQEEFFKKDMAPVINTEVPTNGEENAKLDRNENCSERKTKNMLMEEAMSCIPEPGSGRVRHLVKAFESLLSLSEGRENEKRNRKSLLMDWLMPPFSPKVAEEIQDFVNLSSFDERDSRLCSSLDGLHDRLSLGSRTSGRGRGSRRHSLDSMRKKNWNKRLKVTNQQPFKLRTEQRGRIKEQIFVKMVTEMVMEEEKKRIPIAQGIPWTTDERECLIKPPVKECTEPLDIVLHSDVRAVERSEFDQYVTERLELAEQSKLERERKQKMQEEEEIKKLRRELVPRAQPMPYFNKPFIPKKSSKPITVPKEPKFHA
ncbi:hypothetical protein KSP40_PGU007083 [Platanthera guangdongensis]|uniref:TPX2 C-terminal domain-containing protein n=1 Tax=Platanthera guangdongensis TaxID=2320717 RepID=A0ABR2MI51_9ASPA